MICSASKTASGWTKPFRIGTWVSTKITGRPISSSRRTKSASASSKRRSMPRMQYQATWICSESGICRICFMALWSSDKISLVVLAHLETLGIDDAQVTDLVEVEVAAAGHRLADTGPRDLLAEDRVDQGRLAHAGLAEDRQVEPPECRVLLLVLGTERISEPVCAARHRPKGTGKQRT